MPQWADLVPQDIADRKAAWDRRHAFRRAFEAGAQQKEIAKAVGLSVQRVWQLIGKARRDVIVGRRDPLEIYLSRKEMLTNLPKRTRAKLGLKDTSY